MDFYVLLKPLLFVGSMGWVIYYFAQLPNKLMELSERWGSQDREGFRDEIISFAFTSLISAALLIYYVLPALKHFPFGFT